MQNKFIKTLKLGVVWLTISFSINILFSKNSIFNYLDKRKQSNALTEKLENTINEKTNLFKKVQYLNSSKNINLDIIEQEIISKLNQIPNGYKIIVE